MKNTRSVSKLGKREEVSTHQAVLHFNKLLRDIKEFVVQFTSLQLTHYPVRHELMKRIQGMCRIQGIYRKQVYNKIINSVPIHMC